MKRRIVLATLLGAAIPAFAVAQGRSPYAGQQTRAIKSLTPEEVKGYLARLSDEQRREIEHVSAAMTASAIPLGRQIVDSEAALDRAFADGSIDARTLATLTTRIGELQGRLRAVHLSAHLATRKLLSADQIAMYDRMRGYDGGGMNIDHAHGR